MARLIAFSGGVESVALLTLSRPGDRLLVLDSWKDGQTAYVQSSVEALSSHYGLNVEKMSLTAGSKVSCIQMMVLFSFGTLRAQSDASISEFWHGMHSGDLIGGQIEYFDRMCRAWELLHPNVKLRMPLRHETKKQQWDRIPKELQKYVHSCLAPVPCGKCGKCQERIDAGIPV